MIRSFPLYDIEPGEFEDLVILLCEEILGPGVIKFSTGPDGGKDGKFTGKAQCFPSKSNPWEGKFIIQAKHTQKHNATCFDNDFKYTLEKEIPKIEQLIKNGEVDHYLLFTNRKLSGKADSIISGIINTRLNINNYIIGIETIQKWLLKYPKIVKQFNLNDLLTPLQFYEEDLKEIIIAFSKLNSDCDDRVTKRLNELKNTDKTIKNELNKLSQEYFDEMIKKGSLSYFPFIEAFLQNPSNIKYCNFYQNTVSDLKEKIIVNRKEYYEFDKIFDEIYDYIREKNTDLKDHRRLIRVFLHYMYWHCDIGIGD